MTEPRSIAFASDRWLTDSRVYNLIWLGRWLERAENIARIIDTTARKSVQLGHDETAFQKNLIEIAAAWGIGLPEDSEVVSLLLRDHPASSIYSSLSAARNNATQVGPVELMRTITSVLLELEGRDELPTSAVETHQLVSVMLSGLSEVYSAIEDSWFHREALSEEEVYKRFVQQQ
jgi:uncharacterized alpha-E superfamily protein